MKIRTSRFGEIDIAEEKILHFEEGIPPFEDFKSYALITSEDTEPFLWLQAVNEPDLAFAVINPFRLFPDYAPTVPEYALESIGHPPDEDILVLSMAVIPQDVSSMTTNLVSPLLINAKTNIGRQVIMDNSPYLVKTPIFDEVGALLNGGDADAGSDA